MRTIVTKAVKNFACGGRKCVCIHICIAMSTHLVGEAYTLLHRNSYEMTPRWGVIPVRNDTPLGGVMTPRRGGVKKKFSCFARIFLLHPPEFFCTPPSSNSWK